MLTSKAAAYPSEDLSGAPTEGSLLAIPTNIRLGLKDLPWTNTLDYYYELSYIISRKSFITLRDGCFFLLSYLFDRFDLNLNF